MRNFNIVNMVTRVTRLFNSLIYNVNSSQPLKFKAVTRRLRWVTMKTTERGAQSRMCLKYKTLAVLNPRNPYVFLKYCL